MERLLPRATVRLLLADGVQIGAGAAQLPSELIPLDSTVEVQPGWEITATQEKGGEVSERSPVPYQVLVPPSLDAFAWTRVDHSVREATIYYTLSVNDPPYNPQLLRSRLRAQ